MDQFQSKTNLAVCHIIQRMVPILALATTPKGSFLRYLAVLLMVWIAKQIMYPVQDPAFWTINFTCTSLYFVLAALNHLLINPKSVSDIANTNDSHISLYSRLVYATRLFTTNRGINTPWQAKNVPPHPDYYPKNVKISYVRFLTRESCIAIWLYFLIDVLNAAGLAAAHELKDSGLPIPSGIQWDLSAEQWLKVGLTNLSVWFLAIRIIIGFYYRAVCILLVILGVTVPEDCPPMFSSMADAYTLRNFWGKYWHQLLRVPMTACSNFISRDVLGLPTPSALERYFNVFLVFLFSALMHLGSDITQGLTAQESGAMSFFLPFAFAYMIEDGVQSLWKRIQGPGAVEGPPTWWQKAIGYCWTFGYLGVTSSIWFAPSMGRPEMHVRMVPFSAVESLGLPVMGSLLLVSGAVLMFVFKIEI